MLYENKINFSYLLKLVLFYKNIFISYHEVRIVWWKYLFSLIFYENIFFMIPWSWYSLVKMDFSIIFCSMKTFLCYLMKILIFWQIYTFSIILWLLQRDDMFSWIPFKRFINSDVFVVPLFWFRNNNYTM